MTAFALLLLLLPLPNAAFCIPPHCSSGPLQSLAAVNPSASPEDPLGLLDVIDQSILMAPLVDGAGESSPATAQSILGNIDRDHERDVNWAKSSLLPFENEVNTPSSGRIHHIRCPIVYEHVTDASSDTTIATRTKVSTPLLNAEEIGLLRKAAESYWARDGHDEPSEKSRFTYQRKGNSEAHLSDVVRYSQQFTSGDISSLVNGMLLQRIYPWIRQAYLSRDEGGSELELYVYDSLFIRYNATEATADNIPGDDGVIPKRGAGQPLHRDLGYVSVNIMLNSQEDFQGGGTVFERQLLPLLSEGYPTANGMQPLKPVGPGHALAHYSSDRHAGSATFDGVRDILVIFLAAAEKNQSSSGPRRAPRWECNARLKSTARAYCSECTVDAHDQLACRILAHRLAIEQVPDDGEAWQYLGMVLLDYNDQQLNDGGLSSDENALELAVSCLEEAAKFTPCDGRLYNNLGIALERLLGFLQDKASNKVAGLDGKIRSAYQTSIKIHSACKQLGCDVDQDFCCACLNYGLYLSKLDEFDNAIDVLSRIAHQEIQVTGNEMDAAAWSRQRVIEDATGLLFFCKRQLNKQLTQAKARS